MARAVHILLLGLTTLAAMLAPASGSHITGVTYHPNGLGQAGLYGNGQVYSQTLTARGQPFEIKSAKAFGETPMHFRYAYDARGKVSTITDLVDSAFSRAFTYDARGRLAAATGGWGAGSFKYDALDNLREKTLGARVVAIAYGTDNRVASVTDTDNLSRSFAYDGRGNTTDDGRFLFTYDHANQPLSANGGTAADAYTYDGNKKRARKISGTTLIYDVYSKVSGGLIYRENVTAGFNLDFVDAGPLTTRLANGGPNAYYHSDHLTSRVAETRTDGTVNWREHYTPFGERLIGEKNGNVQGFTNHVRDAATGLNYMQARYYDPIIGRFLQTDPIGYEDQMNLYAYVANDPVNATDPTGEFANIAIGAIAGAVIGGAIEAVTNKEATRGSIIRAALVGAATGAVGPAGGTALRAALVGKGAASAAKAVALPNGKALVTVTDLAADVVGQPILGAADAALQGQDPGMGAVEGVGAAGAAAGAEALTGGGASSSKPGLRGTAAAAGKALVKQGIKAVTSKGGAEAVKQAEPPPVKEELE